MQEPALKLLPSDDEAPSAKLADRWWGPMGAEKIMQYWQRPWSGTGAALHLNLSCADVFFQRQSQHPDTNPLTSFCSCSWWTCWWPFFCFDTQRFFVWDQGWKIDDLVDPVVEGVEDVPDIQPGFPKCSAVDEKHEHAPVGMTTIPSFANV